MEYDSIIESILFAAGDPFPVSRLASLLEISENEVLDAAKRLGDGYQYENRGIRLVRLEDSLQLCSASENAQECRRRLKLHGSPRCVQLAAGLQKALIHQQTHRIAAVHAADLFDIGARHRLEIGCDGQHLQGCRTEPRRFPGVQRLPYPLRIFRGGAKL